MQNARDVLEKFPSAWGGAGSFTAGAAAYLLNINTTLETATLLVGVLVGIVSLVSAILKLTHQLKSKDEKVQ